MQTSIAQSSTAQTSAIFRTWLAFGLAANLAFAANSEPTLFGPAWLWLIAIPLSAYALMSLPGVLQAIAQKTKRAWSFRTQAQAIRVRR